MAIRFDAAADRIVRTSGVLDYNSAYTWMGWFRIVTDTNDYTAFLATHRNDSSSFDNEDWLGTGSDGTTLQLYCAGNSAGSSFDGSALSTGTWFHLALVRSSTTLLTAYLNGASNITHTRNVASRAASTRMESGGQYTANLNSLNGRTTAQKIWTAALSADEILAEMNAIRPLRLNDLWLWTPLLISGDVADYSGNGRSWTAGGTLTTEDGPPVTWGAAPWVVPFVAVSGGITGTAAITQDGQTVAAVGVVTIVGAASITQDGQTVSAAGNVGNVPILGSAAITQDGQTVSAAGVVAIVGAASITQDGQTVAAVGVVTIVGAASITQDGQTVSAAGAVAIVGGASMTQDGNTIAATMALDLVLTVVYGAVLGMRAGGGVRGSQAAGTVAGSKATGSM